jgi:hypothetical protein
MCVPRALQRACPRARMTCSAWERGRQRQITFILVAPALLLQLAIMGWAHTHESGLGNSTTFGSFLQSRACFSAGEGLTRQRDTREMGRASARQ